MAGNDPIPGVQRLTNALMQKIIGEIYALTKESKGIAVQDRVLFEDDLRGRAYQLEKFVRENVDQFAQSVVANTGASSRPMAPPPPPPPADAPSAPPRQAQGSSQRHKFLLRLMAGKFANLYSGPKAYLPRQVIGGFDSYLQRLMGVSKYEELNEHAQELLDKIPFREDDKIWKTIMENEGFRMFAFNILIRILLKFEDFEWAKRNFISIVNNVTDRDAKFLFEDRHFKMLFVTLFAEVFDAILVEEEMERIDELFGPDTTHKIIKIHKAFKKLA